MLPGRPELYLSKLLNNENRSRFFVAPLAVLARRGQCFQHGLVEDRAASGARRLRKAGRARPEGAGGRGREKSYS